MRTTSTYAAALLGVAGLFCCSSRTPEHDDDDARGGAMGGTPATGAIATQTGGAAGSGEPSGNGASSGMTVESTGGVGGTGGSTGAPGGTSGSGATAIGGEGGVGGAIASGGVGGGGTSGAGTGSSGTSGAGVGGGGTSGSGASGGATTGGAPAGGAGAGGDVTGGTGAGGATTGGATTGGAATGGGGTVECTLPDLPDDLNSLPRNEKLPDPFTFFDGTPVTTKEQWECRRREIQAMAAKYVYGPYPFEPDETTGSVSGDTVSMSCREGSRTENFTAVISGSGDTIALELLGGIVPENSKRLSFEAGFEDKIKTLFGLSEINPNVATGWMVDRVMEVLEQHPESGHDPRKMVVSGCSGCGKGAFLVGIFSRIPLTIIVESGPGGGAVNLRQSEWFRRGDGRELWQCGGAPPPLSLDNLEGDGICGPWVTSAADPLLADLSQVYHLPFDQHLLLASIAPRFLLHFSIYNGVDSWCSLNGTGEALSAWAAKPVWNALGVPENMGFLMYDATHCGNPSEATALANEFFQRAFAGDADALTDVMQIPEDGVQQPVSEWRDTWVDWDLETVLR
jgi:hypothetical protein